MSTTNFPQVQQRIEEHQLRHELLDLQSGAFVAVLERGGRILGPFLSDTGESVLWLNESWADAADFSAFLAGGNWNLGGERVWIAPEIQYGVGDRTDFWGTVQCPPAVDPGAYRLERIDPRRVRLSQQIELQAHNLATGVKELQIGREVLPAANPLHGLSDYAELMEGVVYAGYEHILDLSEAKTDAILSEGWNVAQLNPGGQIFIPASPLVAYSDYFAPAGDEHLAIDRAAGLVRVQITGRKQFKVGFKAAHVFGRLAYANRLRDGRAYLLIRHFFNNPSRPYAEEPPHLPGCRGHSVHVYNDGGGFGGFGELEVMAQTIGGESGRSASGDSFLFWLYVGPEHRLDLIARHLLGVTLAV